MLVFSTRLPLKSHVTRTDCAGTVMNWIISSRHYNVDAIPYNPESKEDFDLELDDVELSARYFKNDRVELSAWRLINREKNAVWINDCIFLDENGAKSMLIQLNCNRTNYADSLPPIHKPRVVWDIIESGLCADDAGLPVTDRPIESDGEYYGACVDVMTGRSKNSMPVVYISCDYWGTAVDPNLLARRLSGVAHVFVERKYETSQRLRKDTGERNAYVGFVGVYFPGSDLCQKHGLSYYKDKREMTEEIIDSVRRALVNHLDASVYNWNQIITLQSRQRMSERHDISSQDKQLLDEYMDIFDQENRELKEKIDQLNRELYSLRAREDSLRAALAKSSDEESFYKSGSEPEFFEGEKNDLLYNVLSQVRVRYDPDSRGRALIDSLLEANPRVGENERIMEEIKAVLYDGSRMTPAKLARLRRAGFEVSDEGKHYKLAYHDKRYMFTVAKTPSDARYGSNLISDMYKIIDIERKVL